MRWVTLCMAVVLIAGCGDESRSPIADPRREALGALISLPAPSLDGEASLEWALLERRSIRDYTAETLDLTELSQLLWAAQGITSDAGQRTAPSAGALYPLVTYVVTSEAWYRYLPPDHELEHLGEGDMRGALAEAALGQEAVGSAAAVFVITGVYARTAGKYGDRAERYVHLEAGHAAQNLLLQAVAGGLGAVPIGAFRDAEVQTVLSLPPDHQPLYLLPVGHPDSRDGP